MITDADLQQDRRLIMRKIQRHRRDNLRKSMKANNNSSSDPNKQKNDTTATIGYGNSDNTGYTSDNSDDYFDPEDILHNDSCHEDLDEDDATQSIMKAVKAAHEQDEKFVGGRVDGEEGYEAMNQALTSPPVAWWAMRKQWQKRGKGLLGRAVGGAVDGEEQVAMGAGGGDEGNGIDDIDASYRLGHVAKGTPSDAGVINHPVMLIDPRNLGYDPTSYRRNPFATVDSKTKHGIKRSHAPTIMYVSRAALQKRKMQQIAYIFAALCVVLLFMFFVSQRKLSHYAMVESPMSLSAYLAGENTDPNEKEKVLLGSEIIRPLQVRGGQASSIVHGSDRYHLLRDVIVDNRISDSEELNNEHSPQYKALNWMSYEDLHPGLGYLSVGSDETAVRKTIQRYALAVTYYATNGPGWNYQLNFLSNKDECEWNSKLENYFIGAGVCNDNGFITALALWSNNLMGALPQELGALNTLTTFSLYDNSMRGPPPRILQSLTGLNVLYLNHNQFQGNLDFLCENKIEVIKADCGKQGTVTCSCCEECGFNINKKSPLRWNR